MAPAVSLPIAPPVPINVVDTVIHNAQQPAIGRLPVVTVSPPVATPGADLLLRQSQAQARSNNVSRNTVPAPQTQAPSLRPSAGFIAQVLAQSVTGTQTLSNLSYAFLQGDKKIVDYPTMIAFGTVKYAPSYAAKPRPESSVPQTELPPPSPEPAPVQLVQKVVRAPVPETIPQPAANPQPETTTKTVQVEAPDAQSYVPQESVTSNQAAAAYAATAAYEAKSSEPVDSSSVNA